MTDIETVTLPRAEYEALLDRLEDAEDISTIEAFRARVASVGFEEATKNYLPAELAWRMLDGEHPIRVWREHRGLTATALANKAGIPQSYLSDIENRKKPGSIDAYARLSGALGVTVDDLLSVEA
jgi:hypothetical protein